MLRIENHACIWYNNRNYSAIRRSVMHYHKVPLLCFLNAATEFILLVTVFILAGVLRAFSPIGSQFGMWDVWTFLPVAGLYALANVACYVSRGLTARCMSRTGASSFFLSGLQTSPAWR